MKRSLILLVLLLSFNSVFANEKTKLSLPDATAIAMLKFTHFDARFKQRGNEVKIYVMDDSEVASSLNSIKGTVPEFPNYLVLTGKTLPKNPVDMIFVGKTSDTNSVKEYAKAHKTLTITNNKGYFNDGMSVGILESKNKITISLNTAQSINEGANWQFDYSNIGMMTIEFKGKLN